MNKFVTHSAKHPNFAVISNNKNLFFDQLKSSIQNLSSDEFYDWIINDVNMCYLLLWLHPVTSVQLNHKQSKVINMKHRSNYERAIRDFKKCWPDYTQLMNEMFDKFEFILRRMSDHIFAQYRYKYEHDMYVHEYLKLKLPFYYNQKIVQMYGLQLKRTGDVKSVDIIRTFPNSPHVTTNHISTNGFVPVGLCIVYNQLKEHIPIELFRICVMYYLDPNKVYTRSHLFKFGIL
jgi:hypothetical protein